MLGQILDGVAAVQQHALVAVDIGDLGFAGTGRGEARIVGEIAGLGVQLADIHHLRANGPGDHRQLDRLVLVRIDKLDRLQIIGGHS